jgi:hypothetical protein
VIPDINASVNKRRAAAFIAALVTMHCSGVVSAASYRYIVRQLHREFFKLALFSGQSGERAKVLRCVGFSRHCAPAKATGRGISTRSIDARQDPSSSLTNHAAGEQIESVRYRG